MTECPTAKYDIRPGSYRSHWPVWRRTGGPTTAGNGVPESDPNRDNPFVRLVSGQSVAVVDTFTLECGVTLRSVPVAYKTWGRLNEGGDNVLVVCHALTGSADVESWYVPWKPTIGPDLAFDSRVFFVVCFNVLGSPYGSASPMTLNPETGRRYGPEFPLATVRDDVRIHRLVLESLGVRQVAAVVGGSMGGMQALEWGVMNADIVQNVVALATSGRHSAWCIGWSEGWRRTPGVFPRLRPGAIWKLICFVLLPLLLRAQRQAIFSDPDYGQSELNPLPS
ncbi:MAG: Alpha/Beta hydrolase protein [Olpidium bornovanus]|uniref:Alpha/Beta hydrolase protein n=1 Tax=Olpidium bornovanus TaxID=278681 RepID=A0A8H8DI18_9FUNG|nr:MAG: Alpha/Beta hydrolase protein [Olpidium bornovanus]